MKLIGVVVIDGERMDVFQTVYKEGNRVGVVIKTENGEPFTTLSVNLPQIPLADNCFFVKTWSENEPFIMEILKCGLFKETGDWTEIGFCKAPVWKLVE